MTKIIFILIPTLCYAAQGMINYKLRDYPHAFIWFSYALGNCGFIWFELSRSQ